MFSPADKAFIQDLLNAILESFPDQAKVHTHKVLDYKTPAQLRNLIDLNLNDKGVGNAKFAEEIQRIIKYSVNTGHPLFLNQLSGGPNMESLLGEFLCAILNPTMATFEVAPVATLIERSLIANLNDMIGFDSNEGIMVTGGSNGNLVGVLCARNQVNPRIKSEGLDNRSYRIYVSADAHYSFSKAANISGIGSQNLSLIPVNADGTMDVKALEKAIQADLKAGAVPLLIGATAGTTVLGAFDPLADIAKVAAKYNVWFHVDAAWGGSCIFSRRERSRLNGIEKADSVSLDGHKSLSTGLITSFFLSKHKGVLKETTGREPGADYLFHSDDTSELDTGTSSFQCGRRADALKLWLLWKLRGTHGIEKIINRQVDLAEYTRAQVKGNPRFQYIPSYFLNVCFQVRPRGGLSANELTLQSRAQLLKSGLAMVNHASNGKGLHFYRLVFPNARTAEKDIDFLLASILEIADTIEAGGEAETELKAA